MPFDPSSDDDAWWNNPGPLRLTVHPQAPSNPPSNAPLIPGARYDDWATRNGPVGGTSYPDDWFVPANAHASTAFPDDWFVLKPSAATSTQPPPNPQSSVLNRPAAPLDPFAAFWSSIPASRVGALAWHPPIFPNASGQFELPAPAPLTAPPEAANGILGGIAKMLAAAVDGQEQAAAYLQRANATGEEGAGPLTNSLPKYDKKTTYGVLITNEGNVVPPPDAVPKNAKARAKPIWYVGDDTMPNQSPPIMQPDFFRNQP